MLDAARCSLPNQRRTDGRGTVLRRALMLAMTDCGACGDALTEEAERITRRLLANLDKKRRGMMERYFEDRAVPVSMCAACFLPTVTALNDELFAETNGPAAL